MMLGKGVRLDAAKVFLFVLWLVCVYRAVTQSIVHDEALTWELYLAGPASDMFTVFDANHHFLNTLLMRASTGVLGLSEFSMRLPALCAAALYFAAVYRIARQTLASSVLVLIAVAALTLNPIVLDFMVAARGYGMALAFWMWAFAELLPRIEGGALPSRRTLVRAAVAISLSVAANLTFLFPAALLAASAVILSWRKSPQPQAKKDRKKQEKTKAPAIWTAFVLPIGVCAVLFCLAAPIDVARSRDFYVGSASIVESLRSLASMSLLYSPAVQRLPFASVFRDIVAFVLAPAVVIAGLLRRETAATVAAGSALLIAMAHLLTGMPWPADRTGLYFPVLVVLTAVMLARQLGRVGWTAVAVLVVVFAAQFNLRSFYVWRYDADTRALAEAIASHRSAGPVRVGGSWQLEPALNFYRVRNGWTWMQPVIPGPIAPGYALYALIPDDAHVARQLQLRTIYTGPVSGSMLAAR